MTTAAQPVAQGAARGVQPSRTERAAVPEVASARRTRAWQQRAGVVLLAVLAFIWTVPMLWGLISSFKSESEAASLPLTIVPEDGFTLGRYATVLELGNVPLWLLNSAITTVAITAITVAISAMAAYALSRTDFRGRKLLLALTIASIMVPPQILIVPLFREMLALNMLDTFWAIILPQVVAPIMVFILKRFFDAIPQELEDAARVDGASRFRIFWNIVLPLSRAPLAAVSIFVFINAWNNFLWPFIAVNNPDRMTMPVGLATVESAFGVQYAQDMAASMLAALPLLVVFVIFQRQIVKGVATTGLGGQ